MPTTSGNIEIVVKAEYKNFKNNASDETSIDIKSDGSSTPIEDDKLKVTLNGEESFSVVKGSYSEAGIKATYNGKDVTDEVTITYQINNTTFTASSELVNNINSLEKGQYEITYTITYNKEKQTLKRTITII